MLKINVEFGRLLLEIVFVIYPRSKPLSSAGHIRSDLVRICIRVVIRALASTLPLLTVHSSSYFSPPAAAFHSRLPVTSLVGLYCHTSALLLLVPDTAYIRFVLHFLTRHDFLNMIPVPGHSHWRMG